MKNKNTVFSLVAALLMLTSTGAILSTAHQPDNTMRLTYTFPTPTISSLTIQDQTYDTVTLPNTAIIGNPGDPSLPAQGAYILLPAHTTLTSITIQGTSYSLGTGYHLQPVSRSIPTNQDPIIPTPNPSVYTSNDLMPATHFQTAGVYKMRGFSILVLSLYPVQYRPASGELLAYPTLDVTITYTTSTAPDPLYRGTPQDFALVQNQIDNPGTITTYQAQPAPKSSADLMILTTDSLVSSFQPLAEAHNASNIRTIIRTLTDAGSTTDPAIIRDYIRTMYETMGISYVLLGGDDTVVPIRECFVSGMDENTTYYEDTMPVDLYFGCLDGTWNSDNDNQWGEPTDGEGGADVDLYADVYVGRACVDNTADANAFVTKSVSYLEVNESDPYMCNALFLSEYLGDYGIASYGSPYMNQLINGSSDDGYTTVGIPDSDYNIITYYDDVNPWDASDLMAAINSGMHYINHLGHASPDYNMKMMTYDVDELTNTKYCFIFTQGCDSGWFDGQDCIAEEFTAKTIHGAFAGVWNARYGFFWSYSTDGDSQRIHRQLWDAVFAENLSTVGAALMDAKADNIFIVNRSCIRWCIYETNLFGDPALDLRGKMPSPPPPPPPTPKVSITAVEGGTRVLHITIQNVGTVNATQVKWIAQIQGGIFNGIQTAATGTVSSISVNGTVTVDAAMPVFGLGKLTVTTNSSYASLWSGTGFVFGPFILKIAKA
jgi:hypothetical protein